MNISKSQIDNLNTYDKVATDCFKVDEKFGFRFNYNFRWFWIKSKIFNNFKSQTSLMKNMPLEERKIFTQIYLN